MHLQRLFENIDRNFGFSFEATNGTTACQLCAMGLGLTLADPFVALNSGGRDLVMKKFIPTITLPYGFVIPKWKTESDATIRLKELISLNAKQKVREFTDGALTGGFLFG